MNDNARVAVTGMGVVSPVGIGLQPFWQALLEGKSGIDVIPTFAETDAPARIGGAVKDFDGKKYVKPRKALKVMCVPIQFGYAAATMAVEDSDINQSGINPERYGTVFGSDMYYADPQDVSRIFYQCVKTGAPIYQSWGDTLNEIEPLWMLKYLPNMAASHISIAENAQGHSNSICQGDASGTLAVIEAVDVVRRGAADAVITGATGSPMSPTGIIYRGMNGLSRRIYEPQRACRPYEVDRDGMVLSEGAGALILERMDHAKARGAKIYAELTGVVRTFHRPDVKNGFVDRMSQALHSAVADAGLKNEQIGHIHACGYSAKQTDVIESRAIAEGFRDTPVIATKSHMGNVGPGAGLLEIIASILALNENRLPKVLNLDQQDPQCPIRIVQDPGEPAGDHALSLSFAATGQIAAVTISKPA